MKGFKATIYIETEDDGDVDESSIKQFFKGLDYGDVEIKLIEVEEVEYGT